MTYTEHQTNEPTVLQRQTNIEMPGLPTYIVGTPTNRGKAAAQHGQTRQSGELPVPGGLRVFVGSGGGELVQEFLGVTLKIPVGIVGG